MGPEGEGGDYVGAEDDGVKEERLKDEGCVFGP